MVLRASPGTTIRLARINDLASVVGLYRQCMVQAGPGNTHLPLVFSSQPHDSQTILQERILDRCLLLAEKQGHVLAATGLDLDLCGLGELLISPEADDGGLIESLVVAAERLAVQFGLQVLNMELPPSAASRFHALGFADLADKAVAQEPPSDAPHQSLQRSLRRRQTTYGRRVHALGNELGIPPGYGRHHRLTLQPEATRLSTMGVDVFGREQQLTPRAAAAWRRMHQTATGNGIELQPVSAWRSVSYQFEVVQRKLAKGLSMEEVLRTSAAPGFSEHHTGRAIDFTTPGYAVLEEEFEHSPAFHWMERHAQEFGFRLSFPRNNRHLLAFEPWHWYFDG